MSVESVFSPSPISAFINNSVMVFDNNTSCGGATSVASADFWIGVISSLAGSVILNLGLNIQKLAFVRNAKVSPDQRKPVYKNCLWIIGFFIFAIGNAGDAVGLTFTAQSIITPIGAIALVSNLFFARILIGELIDLKTTGAILAIISGVIAIVASGNTNCSSVTLGTLKKNFVKPGVLIFATVNLGTLTVLLLYSCFMERKMVQKIFVGGGGGSRSNIKTKFLGLLNFSEQERNRLRLAYPLCASCIGAWTVLLSKSTGELVKESVRSGQNEFDKVESWFIGGGFLISLPLQFLYINKGLAHFESLYIIPIFYSTWLIGSILMGALFWDEFAGFSVWQFIVFGLGVLFVIIGVVLLQGRDIPIDLEIVDDDEIIGVGEKNGAVNNDCSTENKVASAHSLTKAGHKSTNSSEGDVVTRMAVGKVLERRNTFFTRAAAAVVSVPLAKRAESRSRNNSAASSYDKEGKNKSKRVFKGKSIEGRNVRDSERNIEIAVDIVEF